ncbi:MAG: ketoacyl-ACP synthase III [Phototrophicales bacterium]
MIIGIIGIGTYFPETIQTAADLVDATGIPAHILHQKMGIRQRHIAKEHETVSYMATQAAKRAIINAEIDPAEIDVVISHGSEYKDHVVWNAAGKIQHNVGAVNAYAFEIYALCAGAPIALNVAKGIMHSDPSIKYVLLAAASRENDLVNLANERTRFMFNFGAGGSALVLQRDAGRNLILGASAFTDGSLSETVVLTDDAVPAGESPVIGDIKGRLDVTDPDYMSQRLGAVSMDRFLQVIQDAVAKSGATIDDIDFMGVVHMKRSFYTALLDACGLTEEQSVYLEDYGHIQSVDQALTLELGLKQGKIKDGDLVVLTGAGVGYTWSAIAIRWGASGTESLS